MTDVLFTEAWHDCGCSLSRGLWTNDSQHLCSLIPGEPWARCSRGQGLTRALVVMRTCSDHGDRSLWRHTQRRGLIDT